MTNPTLGLLQGIMAELARWDENHGTRDYPDGTGPDEGREQERDVARIVTDTQAKHGDLTWRQILLGAVSEAIATSTPSGLRAELVQVATVAVTWVEAIDRRDTTSAAREPQAGERWRDRDGDVWEAVSAPDRVALSIGRFGPMPIELVLDCHSPLTLVPEVEQPTEVEQAEGL